MFIKNSYKRLIKLVAVFMYISTFFLNYFEDFTFHFISTANASALIADSEVKYSKKNNQIFTQGLLKNKHSMPRSAFFSENNESYQLKDFRGHLIILYFWASWSYDSLEGLHKLQQLQQELDYQEIRDIAIVPISLDFKAVSQIKSLLTTKGLTTLRIFIDPSKELMGELSFHSLPQTFLIDKDGYIFANYVRPIDWSQRDFYQELMSVKGDSLEIVPTIIKPAAAPPPVNPQEQKQPKVKDEQTEAQPSVRDPAASEVQPTANYRENKQSVNNSSDTSQINGIIPLKQSNEQKRPTFLR